jgi:putative membrane protein
MMWNDWGAMGLFGWTMMLLFWVTLVLVIVWVARSWNGRSSGAVRPDALELLRRRYARGEIELDEYQERREALINSS